MWSPRTLIFTGVAAVLLLSPLTAGAAAHDVPSKADRAVRASVANGDASQNVIITVKAGYRDTIRLALLQHGDVIRSEHPLIEAITVSLHGSDVAELSRQDWVLSIAADARVSAKDNDRNDSGATSGRLPTQPAITLPGTLRETLGLPRVANSGWQSGASGITVAIIDSGIAPNEDFAGRIVGFYDFTRGGAPVAPYDDYGHGTHVAGLIASSGKLSNYQYQGVAPDVRLVGLKVLDSNGMGKTSDVIRAIEYVTANKAKLNVQIINLSLGHPIYAAAKDDPLVQAVEKATASGLIVVTAAGNFGESQNTGAPGYAGITSPGNAPSAITVGATMTSDTVTRVDDAVAPYSSRGPTWVDAFAKPDVVAPGHQLTSDTSLSSSLYKLLQTGHVKAKNGQALLQLSGTSMATAVTTGVVALMLQERNQDGYRRQPPLTANLVKGMLEFSAIHVAGADRLTQGAGQINAAGAMALAHAIDTDVRNGQWWLGTGVTASTVIGARSYPWSSTVTWNGSVLGGNLLFVSNKVWTSNIVWGTASDGDNIVWGTNAVVRAANIVWSTDIVWGTNLVWGDRAIGQTVGDNIVWSTRADGDNIVWGTLDGDNIVWGMTADGDNIVWGTAADGDNIVWGTAADGDNIVWGTVVPKGTRF